MFYRYRYFNNCGSISMFFFVIFCSLTFVFNPSSKVFGYESLELKSGGEHEVLSEILQPFCGLTLYGACCCCCLVVLFSTVCVCVFAARHTRKC